MSHFSHLNEEIIKVNVNDQIDTKPKTLRVEFVFLDDGESLQDWKFAFKAFFSSGLEIRIETLDGS